MGRAGPAGMPMERQDQRAGTAPATETIPVTFREGDFAASAALQAAYRRDCLRGYARMAQRRVAVAAVCRNVAWILPATIRRLQRLMGLFNAARMVVYENDSLDGSQLLLRRWAATDPRVEVTMESLGDPVNPQRRCASRAVRMAGYRARCQQAVLSRWGQFDAVIVVDMDLVGGWSEDGIAHTFGQDGWDFVGANGLIYRRCGLDGNQLRQCDTWAYRRHGDDAPVDSALASQLVPRRGEPLIEVGSCFGGMGVYSMEAFAAGDYAGSDCEHVNFHRSLKARGFDRLFLNPSLITLYGRRHRSTDRLVRRMVVAWSRLQGRDAARWEFESPERIAAGLEPERERFRDCG